MLLIEDLHWSSDSLLDLIESILQPRGDAPILMLALTRPELLERRTAWGAGRRNHISMALEPLDSGSIEQLVQHMLDGPSPELVPVVVGRSEGNPFYAGEIIRSLIERGVDLRDSAAIASAAAGLPDTVQATVLARLDALDAVARRVLQLGAVLGRGFAAPAVAALEPGLAAELDGAIDRLMERDLLRPGARSELTFRHILIRDVAYGTLPRAERARHHAAAGRWLEGQAVGREDELAELVAFHYREAAALAAAMGEANPDVAGRAVTWLRRAADVAEGARGMAEAAAHLRAALDLAPASQHPDLYARLGLVHYAGDPSVAAFHAAWTTGEAQGRGVDFLLDNLAQQLLVMCRWFASVARQPGLGEIEALIARGFDWLPEASDRPRARFLIAISFLPFWLRNASVRVPTGEDLELARSRAAEGLAIAERIDDAGLISAGLDAMTSHDQTVMPAHARELSERRVAMSRRLPLDERLDALGMVAWTSALLGDFPPLLRASETALDLIQPGQNAGFALGSASWHAYASAFHGRWDRLVTDVDLLRAHWIEAERPAASYALQGLLSGIDWARNRGDEQTTQRWSEVADDILGHYADAHPWPPCGRCSSPTSMASRASSAAPRATRTASTTSSTPWPSPRTEATRCRCRRSTRSRARPRRAGCGSSWPRRAGCGASWRATRRSSPRASCCSRRWSDPLRGASPARAGPAHRRRRAPPGRGAGARRARRARRPRPDAGRAETAAQPTPASRSSCGMCDGESATAMPAASSAARFDFAVPAPPEMIAPAWPIRRPGGAVRPAMNDAIGLRTSRADERRRLLLLLAADLADEDDRLGVRVLVEEVEHVDEVRADDRVAADPDAGRLAHAGIGHGLHDLVGQGPGARDEPHRAVGVDVARDDPHLCLAGRGRRRGSWDR